MKKDIPAWTARGFETFNDEWLKIFLGGAVFGSIIATLTWFVRDYNTLSALLLGLFASLGGMAAYTDSIIRKVPLELIHYLCYISLAGMIAVVFGANSDTVRTMYGLDGLYMRVPLEAIMTNLGFGAVMLLAGFLGFVKIPGYGIAKVCLFFAQLGAVILVYTPLSYLAFSARIEYWSPIAQALIPYLLVLSVVWVFSWMVGDLIGGADITVMYAAGLALTPVAGPEITLFSIVVATILQGFMHLLGERVHYGAKRSIKNGKVSQFFENRKAKKEGREAETHKLRIAMPFLPVLIATMIFMCATMGTFA